MSNETSPRPWQVRYGDTVADATGAKVAACLRQENAALIVDAVNEIERLRAENQKMRNAILTILHHEEKSVACDLHRFHPEIRECRGILADGTECWNKDSCEFIFYARGMLSENTDNAPAGFDPYCARHGCPNCRIYTRLQEAKKKEESK